MRIYQVHGKIECFIIFFWNILENITPMWWNISIDGTKKMRAAKRGTALVMPFHFLGNFCPGPCFSNYLIPLWTIKRDGLNSMMWLSIERGRHMTGIIMFQMINLRYWRGKILDGARLENSQKSGASTGTGFLVRVWASWSIALR